MEDKQIIKLYFARAESAIEETANKYGKYCHVIAYNILYNDEDSEECVNDTYLKAWNVMPPQCPNILSAFLGKITRNLALDKYRYNNRKKRGGSQIAFALEELEDCIPAKNTVEQAIEDEALVEVLNNFLEGLAEENRKFFMQRYWYMRTIREIATEYGVSESKVKMVLMRCRNQLKQILEQEGIAL